MSLSINRKTLQQAIDQLPENRLPELARFIEFLQFKTAHPDLADTWPPDFFEEVIGGWQGKPLERPDQGVFEERDALL